VTPAIAEALPSRQKLRIGSLFSGVGGLDMAVEAFFDAETVWHCEWDEEPSKVLAARWPGIPNHRDVTAVDWAAVEPVDILCGGFPCQDLSTAGRRSGLRPGTRSGLWSDFRKAIDVLRPSVVIIENVRGLLSGCAESDSDVEPCPGCVAEERGVAHAPRLRALGRVLGDLDALGFDAEWHGLPASDVGAPHGRFRVFIVAIAREAKLDGRWPVRGSRPVGGVNAANNRPLLRTPMADELGGGLLHPNVARERGQTLRLSGQILALTGHLLPTPSASSPNEDEPIDAWVARRERVKESGINGNGFGMPLGVAVRLLPTTTTRDADGSGGNTPANVTLTDAVVRTDLGRRENPRHFPTPTTEPDTGNGHARNLSRELEDVADRVSWGEYEAAVRLWESLTRSVPAPTAPDGKGGTHRLSAAFPEWMMGYPRGWVTDILDRKPAIRACGNGVVPQQAFTALGITWERALEWVERVAA